MSYLLSSLGFSKFFKANLILVLGLFPNFLAPFNTELLGVHSLFSRISWLFCLNLIKSSGLHLADRIFTQYKCMVNSQESCIYQSLCIKKLRNVHLSIYLTMGIRIYYKNMIFYSLNRQRETIGKNVQIKIIDVKFKKL